MTTTLVSYYESTNTDKVADGAIRKFVKLINVAATSNLRGKERFPFFVTHYAYIGKHVTLSKLSIDIWRKPTNNTLLKTILPVCYKFQLKLYVAEITPSHPNIVFVLINSTFIEDAAIKKLLNESNIEALILECRMK
jgi:hypothetical protein